MNKDELYHFGIPGMRWGKRKAIKYTNKTNVGKEATKKHTENSKRVGKVLGVTVATAALAGVGAMLVSKTAQQKALGLTAAKSILGNM